LEVIAIEKSAGTLVSYAQVDRDAASAVGVRSGRCTAHVTALAEYSMNHQRLDAADFSMISMKPTANRFQQLISERYRLCVCFNQPAMGLAMRQLQGETYS
jgi:hypothetical protein